MSHQPDAVLVHGLFTGAGTTLSKKAARRIRAAREEAFTLQADALGICSYEWLDGTARALANKGLQKMRGTAPAVDAVEIMTADGPALDETLQSDPGRDLWRKVAACESHGFDPIKSFILMGSPLHLLEGSSGGQRLIWFGNGLETLSRAEFIAHYTTRHGPLVANHARLIGLRRYRQVPDEGNGACATLRKLGLGQAVPPAVFAELVMGAPSFSLRGYREATGEIKADEKRHIDFSRSMLLLPGR